MNLVNLFNFQEWLINAWAWLKDFFNQPIPIIGVSVGFALFCILKIISSTSIGKKSLNEFKRKTKVLNDSFKELYNSNEK